MKLRYLLPCAVALLGFSIADAQSVSTSSIPHLEKRGQATQLMVDGAIRETESVSPSAAAVALYERSHRVYQGLYPALKPIYGQIVGL
jgi:hypothetical protein